MSNHPSAQPSTIFLLCLDDLCSLANLNCVALNAMKKFLRVKSARVSLNAKKQPQKSYRLVGLVLMQRNSRLQIPCRVERHSPESSGSFPIRYMFLIPGPRQRCHNKQMNPRRQVLAPEQTTPFIRHSKFFVCIETEVERCCRESLSKNICEFQS